MLTADSTTKITESASLTERTFGTSTPFTKSSANELTATQALATGIKNGTVHKSQEELARSEALLAENKKVVADGRARIAAGEFANDPERLQRLEIALAKAEAAQVQSQKNIDLSKAAYAAAAAEQPTASSVKASATGAKPVTSDHLVSLSDGVDTVEFEVMPEVTENHTVEYEAVAPAQSPGAFQKYKGTSSTTWMLQVTLISRTSAEATDNFYRLCTLRGWTKPFFGEMTGQIFQGQLGAPPPVLTLRGLRGLYGPVPVVITSLNFVWPRDVDYLPTNVRGTVIGGNDDNWVPFPVLLTLPIGLTESFSTTQFNQFNLADYRTGNMRSAFNVPVAAIDYSNENYDSKFAAAEYGSYERRIAAQNFDSRRYPKVTEPADTSRAWTPIGSRGAIGAWENDPPAPTLYVRDSAGFLGPAAE